MFYGWRVVGGTFLIYLISGGLYNTGTLYFKALTEEFGWGRGEVSAAFALGILVGGLAAPVWGRIADRAGPRSAFVPGVILTGLSCFGLSMISSIPSLYVLYFLFSIASAGISLVPVSVVLSNWFVLKRGRAIGIAYTGVGVGEFLLTPAAGFLIVAVGWRQAYLISGVVVLALLTPVALWIKNRPQDIGLLPDGATKHGGSTLVSSSSDARVTAARAESSPAPALEAAQRSTVAGVAAVAAPVLGAESAENLAAQAERSRGFSLAEALRTPAFWLTAVTWPLAMGPLMAIILHQVSFMTDTGLSTEAASVVAGAVGGTSMFGRIGYGFLSERYPMRFIYASCYVLLAAGVFSLSVSASVGVPALVSYAVCLGLGVGGAFALAPLMVADLFGVKSLGEIFGLLGLAATVGGAIGATGAGVLYDRVGNYDVVFQIAVAAAIIATILMLMIRRPAPQCSRAPA